MKRTYLSALAALAFASSAFACGPNDYIGSICTTPTTYCPNGTLAADGSVINIQQYKALYSLIGHTYDGGRDSDMTFGLPNLNGRTPVGIGLGSKTDNSGYLNLVVLGEVRGQESVPLQVKNLPAHTHPFAPTTGKKYVIIPETKGSGTTLSGTVGVVPNQGNIGNDFTPVAGKTYQLAGASIVGSQSLIGPYSTYPLPATPAKVSGVSVDASGMTPAIPAKTVTVQTLSGGTVGTNSSVKSSIMATVPPQLGLRYCIVWDGTYPDRP